MQADTIAYLQLVEQPSGALEADHYQAPSAAEEEDSWQDSALCAEVDGEIFFPEKGGSTAEAKKVCRSCFVRADCLEYALDNDERFGIWGGLSERERRKLKRTAVAA